MRYYMIVVVGLFLCLPLNAQNNRQYTLHQSTALEYVSHVIDVFEQLELSDMSSQDQYALRMMVTDEFKRTYDFNSLSDIPFHILNSLTPDLNLSVIYDYNNFISIPGWHNMLFNTWLRETQPDLGSQPEWQFGDYTLLVTPVDFTGDNMDEYSVTLSYQTGDWVEYIEYFVLEQDDSLPEGISTIE